MSSVVHWKRTVGKPTFSDDDDGHEWNEGKERFLWSESNLAPSRYEADAYLICAIPTRSKQFRYSEGGMAGKIRKKNNAPLLLTKTMLERELSCGMKWPKGKVKYAECNQKSRLRES